MENPLPVTYRVEVSPSLTLEKLLAFSFHIRPFRFCFSLARGPYDMSLGEGELAALLFRMFNGTWERNAHVMISLSIFPRTSGQAPLILLVFYSAVFRGGGEPTSLIFRLKVEDATSLFHRASFTPQTSAFTVPYYYPTRFTYVNHDGASQLKDRIR